MNTPAAVCLVLALTLLAAAAAYGIAFLAILAGALICTAAAALGFGRDEADEADGTHDGLMDMLGHPVGQLPRRWTRKDWAELDTLTTPVKD